MRPAHILVLAAQCWTQPSFPRLLSSLLCLRGSPCPAPSRVCRARRPQALLLRVVLAVLLQHLRLRSNVVLQGNMVVKWWVFVGKSTFVGHFREEAFNGWCCISQVAFPCPSLCGKICGQKGAQRSLECWVNRWRELSQGDLQVPEEGASTGSKCGLCKR